MAPRDHLQEYNRQEKKIIKKKKSITERSPKGNTQNKNSFVAPTNHIPFHSLSSAKLLEQYNQEFPLWNKPAIDKSFYLVSYISEETSISTERKTSIR